MGLLAACFTCVFTVSGALQLYEGEPYCSFMKAQLFLEDNLSGLGSVRIEAGALMTCTGDCLHENMTGGWIADKLSVHGMPSFTWIIIADGKFMIAQCGTDRFLCWLARYDRYRLQPNWVQWGVSVQKGDDGEIRFTFFTWYQSRRFSLSLDRGWGQTISGAAVFSVLVWNDLGLSQYTLSKHSAWRAIATVPDMEREKLRNTKRGLMERLGRLLYWYCFHYRMSFLWLYECPHIVGILLLVMPLHISSIVSVVALKKRKKKNRRHYIF